MSDSLKDQLLALGLARQSTKAAGRAQQPTKKSRKNRDQDALSLDRAYTLRAQQEAQAARNKKEQKRLQDLERRRINTRIQELADAHGLNDAAAEIKRNFIYKGRIRSVLVTPEQLRALNAGELGVVFLRGAYILMRPEHVQRVRAISPDHVPELGGSEPGDELEDERHKVPDDLVW